MITKGFCKDKAASRLTSKMKAVLRSAAKPVKGSQDLLLDGYPLKEIEDFQEIIGCCGPRYPFMNLNKIRQKKV